MEALVRSQAHLLEAQAQVEREHKDLLRAQVLMVDEIRGIAGAQKKTEAALASLTLKMEEITDKLNALINYADRRDRGN